MAHPPAGEAGAPGGTRRSVRRRRAGAGGEDVPDEEDEEEPPGDGAPRPPRRRRYPSPEELSPEFRAMFSQSQPNTLAQLENLPASLPPATRYGLQVALVTKMHCEVQSRVMSRLSTTVKSMSALCHNLAQQHSMLAHMVAAEVMLGQPAQLAFAQMAAQAAQMAAEVQNMGAPIPELEDMVRRVTQQRANANAAARQISDSGGDDDGDDDEEEPDEDADDAAAAAAAPAAA